VLPTALVSNKSFYFFPDGAIIRVFVGSGCRMNALPLNGLRKIHKPLAAHSAQAA
jgi:hypothetical protein